MQQTGPNLKARYCGRCMRRCNRIIASICMISGHYSPPEIRGSRLPFHFWRRRMTWKEVYPRPGNEAWQLIAGMHQVLQTLIPDQTGRYDDAYNPNCVGDTFQALRSPTILFEAGHTGKDYQREQTREYIFHALLQALEQITSPPADIPGTDLYFAIPENQKLFYDILIRNADQINPKYEKGTHLGILYQEVLRDSQIVFEPKIEASGPLSGYFGHASYDCLLEEDRSKLSKDKALRSLIGLNIPDKYGMYFTYISKNT